MTRAMFGGASVGLLGRSEVGDRGVVSGLMSSSLVDNSYTTGVEVEDTGIGLLLGFSPPLVPCLRPGLSVACSTCRGWGDTSIGRHLLEVQVALGSPLGGLGSGLLFLELGRSDLLRSVPRVRAGTFVR